MTSPPRPMTRFHNSFTEMFLGWPLVVFFFIILDWKVSKEVPAVLAVGAGRFFLPLYWSFFFGRKYREKDSLTHAAGKSRSPFPHFCTKKLSRTCCTCSRGGSLFLPYPIQPHPLSPLIMVRLKRTSLETFQSNMIRKTPANVTSTVMLFHGFRSAGKWDLTLAQFRIWYFKYL